MNRREFMQNVAALPAVVAVPSLLREPEDLAISIEAIISADMRDCFVRAFEQPYLLGRVWR